MWLSAVYSGGAIRASWWQPWVAGRWAPKSWKSGQVCWNQWGARIQALDFERKTRRKIGLKGRIRFFLQSWVGVACSLHPLKLPLPLLLRHGLGPHRRHTPCAGVDRVEEGCRPCWGRECIRHRYPLSKIQRKAAEKRKRTSRGQRRSRQPRCWRRWRRHKLVRREWWTKWATRVWGAKDAARAWQIFDLQVEPNPALSELSVKGGQANDNGLFRLGTGCLWHLL